MQFMTRVKQCLNKINTHIFTTTFQAFEELVFESAQYHVFVYVLNYRAKYMARRSGQ